MSQFSDPRMNSIAIFGDSSSNLCALLSMILHISQSFAVPARWLSVFVTFTVAVPGMSVFAKASSNEDLSQKS